jgi:hypothetical protein
MPVYILLLIAVAPVVAMVATAGNALGRHAQLAAVIALPIILSALIAWLVIGTVRIVFETWRRVKPRLTSSSDTNIYRSADHGKLQSLHRRSMSS